jgi:AraC-like DNA-binding protein
LSAARQELEWLMALIYCGVRAATGVAFHPLAVEFAVAAPQDTREHERVFGCPVRFGQEANRLWVSRVDWERTNRNANTELLRILELRASGLAAEMPELDSVCDAVRSVACLNLDQGPPTIEQLAKQLSLSPRTLQRRLAAEGASFSELVDQARETTSRRLLHEHSLSLAEIAHLVGFSEQSAFTRAFKKWTGTTPAQFRRSAVAPSPPRSSRRAG